MGVLSRLSSQHLNTNGRCSRFCASLRLEPDPSSWSLDYDDAVLEMLPGCVMSLLVDFGGGPISNSFAFMEPAFSTILD